MARRKKVLVRKVREYRRRLVELLSDERIVFSLLRDPEMRFKLLYVAGALKIPLPLGVLRVQDASGVTYRVSPVTP